MQKHPALTIRRIERFLKNELTALLWTRQVDLAISVYRPEGPLAPAEAPNQTFAPVAPGFQWGPIWTDAWFCLKGAVPAEWAGETVCARIDLGAEAVIWEGDNPVQGVDWAHGEYRVFETAHGGEEVVLYARANGMNPSVSCDAKPNAPSTTPFTLKHATLAVWDAALWGLYFDLNVAFGVMKELPENEPRRGQLLYALNAAVNAFDPQDRASIAEARRIVAAEYDKPASASAHRISATGHAHIDTAWLWPLERTRQKCLHTFSTATRFMESYPEYHFICSQAQQYEWVKEMAPKLYERIQQKAKAGQWEVAGSMWVEADCNISGGESLVRQILVAKNFWMDEFGIETVDLWLPDVFGYSAALPQILTRAGVKYFLTQKISWNQTNKFPHHTFLWQGIDGTRIFTHFLPADTYNGDFTPKELAYNVHNFKDHDRATRSLYAFGHGDGGGGPTIEMLENARRLRNAEGMPIVEQEQARDFFRKAEEDAADLPVWVGELYLELHRGTYTTQAANKRGNRKSEFLLRDAELLAAVNPAGLGAYPYDTLMKAWKLVLLNQFHDIIPGSSVNEVYRDSAVDYAEIARLGGQVVDQGLAALGAAVSTEGYGRPVLVTRTSPDRGIYETITLPIGDAPEPRAVRYNGDAPAPVQIVEEDGVKAVLFQEQMAEEGLGYTVYDFVEAPSEQDNAMIVTERLIDNGILRVEFNDAGLITRIYDQVFDREVMGPHDLGNQFQLFEDRPLYWDAWDIDPYYQEKGRTLTELDSVELLEEGPVRAALRFTRTFGGSKIVQTVRLAHMSRRLEFVTDVDWHEEHKLLKAAFPVAINASRATYEIQYGHVERPTHTNTSWDMARFEVAAQKWVDISEGNYGVALLNDCKYGHDTVGSTLRLTLLRSPKAPDPEADMGRHRFTYAIMPHEGDFRQGQVIDHAYHLNAPPRAALVTPGQKGSLPDEGTFFAVDRSNVIIESVKRAEREQAIVVRLYEAHNDRGSVTLRTALPFKKAYLTDLLERNERELEATDGSVTFNIKPLEIVTVKLLV